MFLDFRGGDAAIFFKDLPAGRGEAVANLGLEPWGEGDVCIWVGHAVLDERMYESDENKLTGVRERDHAIRKSLLAILSQSFIK